jgi:hypothetical protein
MPNIVLYCHAFSDAPCTLPRSKFHNLCSPLVSTRKIFELCRELPVNLYVKTHPSTFSQDEASLNALLDEYPEISRLPSELAPFDLHELGIDVIITGWGNICFEAGFLGIPTIAYTPFYQVAELGLVPTFDIEDRGSFARVLRSALSGIERNEFQKVRISEGYAMVNLGGFVDLTASGVTSLPREGPEGRYALFAYKHWADTFIEKDFICLVESLGEYLEQRLGVFSRFLVRAA